MAQCHFTWESYEGHVRCDLLPGHGYRHIYRRDLEHPSQDSWVVVGYEHLRNGRWLDDAIA